MSIVLNTIYIDWWGIMMLKMVWDYIMRIFGITKTNTTGEQMMENMAFTQKYETAHEMNLTAIFANKLAT